MEKVTSVPRGTAEYELIDRRSRFLGRAVGVSNPDEAREMIARRREEHSGCSHVVYAFITGPPKSTTMGMSDDGEPKGTAGKPVLEVVKGSGITNVLLTVVRYFGGTKLGTGGLVRAYGGCAKETLRLLRTEPYEIRRPFSLVVPYDLYEPVKRTVETWGGHIDSEDFATTVQIIGEISENMVQLLQPKIRDITGGIVELRLSRDTE